MNTYNRWKPRILTVRQWAMLTCGGILLALCTQAQPARIVTTFPSVTETVFALGAGDRVVGVSTYCNFPSAVLSLPKIGTYIKPDLEKIAFLRPDLVIIQDSAASLAERLAALGIPHAAVKVGSLADIYSMITDLGRVIGSPERAAKLNSDIQISLGRFRSESIRKPRPTVLVIIGRTPGLLSNLIAVSPTAYLGELLEIAGGKNVLTDTAMDYPHISLETVIRLNPDFILDLSQMGDSKGMDKAIEARLREPWLTHQELTAVRNGQVFGLASESLVTPGPRVVDAVQLLRGKIHQRERQ